MTVLTDSSFFVHCPYCAHHFCIDSSSMEACLNQHMVLCPLAGTQAQAMDVLLSLCSELQQQLRRNELARQYEALERSRSGSPIAYGRAYRRAKRERRKRAHKRRRCNIKRGRY